MEHTVHAAHAAILGRLIAHQDLEGEEVEALFGSLMDGELGDVTKAAILVALAAKGETAAEIAGAARAMRGRAVVIPHRVADAVDTCGTGGDGRGTFNISTAAALVAAAAGVPIAKHGNRSVSSRSGSADVLGALGVDLELSAQDLGRCLETVGIAFLFAPRLHPAMREVMSVRRELGVRTLFNVLGPLTNPAGARRQLLGVFAPRLVVPLAEVLRELGADHALVVHGDGLDEITTAGPTLVAEVRDAKVEVFELTPEELGVERGSSGGLAGGTPEENAEMMTAVLAGVSGPLGEVVAANAGAAIYVGGRAQSLREGVSRARGVLANGGGAAKLAELVAFAAECRRQDGQQDDQENADGRAR